MSTEKLIFAVTALVLHALSAETCNAKTNPPCLPSSCGSIDNISYPFRLNTDPRNCGVSRYTLSCHNNRTVVNLKYGRYYVQAINYNNYTIRLVETGVRKDNCSSIPQHSLSYYNITSPDLAPYNLSWTYYRSRNILFINCAKPVKAPLYLNSSDCLDPESKGYSYVKIGHTRASDLRDSCRIVLMAMTTLLADDDKKNVTYLDIHDALAYGFELSWSQLCCGKCRFWPLKRCIIDETNHVHCGLPLFFSTLPGMVMAIIVYTHIVTFICGIPCVTVFLVRTWRRRHLSMYHTVEEFLQSHNNLMPVRYSHEDVKKMTNGFKDKLGEGGYGCVYKGKLRSGRFAAIKMLSKSKSDGQDFINEVATIGMIHHTNVVKLIGFCVEGSKRSLVYDFMPNGSLDKHIFSSDSETALSRQKTYEIALGVARGIEYLHRGCDMQILHFDIKPHNILLDDNFIPKVSDFGLAKLYAVGDSIVPLTAARGTMGYMAPELFYKNIGGVSYKADVYSFGMLLLEMIGMRKNLNPLAEHSSEIYFPIHIYGQIVKGKNVNEAGDVIEEENEMIKKMTIVALWCIQLKPSDRPSMNNIVEMLEGESESLQIPPKPLLYPEETSSVTTRSQTNETESSTTVELALLHSQKQRPLIQLWILHPGGQALTQSESLLHLASMIGTALAAIFGGKQIHFPNRQIPKPTSSHLVAQSSSVEHSCATVFDTPA